MGTKMNLGTVTLTLAVASVLACGFGGRNERPPAPQQPPAPPPSVNVTTAPPPAAKTAAPLKTGVPAQPARIGGCSKIPNGETCRIQGSGFGFGESVSLTFSGTGTPRQVARADQNGNFTWDLAIRSSPGTVITVRASGTTSGRTAEFSYTLT